MKIGHRRLPAAWLGAVPMMITLATAVLAGPSVARAAAPTLYPTLDCVVNQGGGVYAAYFGYVNTMPVSEFLDVGDTNEFVPGVQFQGQPTTFDPGSYPDVLVVLFDPVIASPSWILNGSVVTASATSPPCLAATTGPAGALTQTGATLSALIDPRGSTTTYHFEYGPTTGYGQSTPPQTVTGSDPSIASVTLSGLTPGATYHYRVDATNPMLGTTNGQDATFTTPSPAVTPTPAALAVTEPASAPNSAAVTLNGVVNPQGNATSYQFDYGPTTAYGRTTATATVDGADPQGVTASLTGLSPATTYHYRLVASQGSLTTTGADLSFTTAPAPIPPPPNAADLAVTALRPLRSAVRDRSIVYTFAVANRGPATATGVTFADLPAGGESVIKVWSLSGRCGTRHGHSSCQINRIAPHQRAVVYVKLVTRVTGRLSDVALALATQPDPTVSDNVATAATRFYDPPRRGRWARRSNRSTRR